MSNSGHRSLVQWPIANVNEVRRVNRNVCGCHYMIDGGYEYMINDLDYKPNKTPLYDPFEEYNSVAYILISVGNGNPDEGFYINYILSLQ